MYFNLIYRGQTTDYITIFKTLQSLVNDEVQLSFAKIDNKLVFRNIGDNGNNVNNETNNNNNNIDTESKCKKCDKKYKINKPYYKTYKRCYKEGDIIY